jgi:hypothetical protein
LLGLYRRETLSVDQNIIVLGIAFLAIIIIIVAYQRVKSAGRLEDKDNETTKQDTPYLREILSRDQLIQNLQARIENINELNNRYLAFMLNVPTVVQRLHATLKFDEIISSITGLVSTIIATDKVEFYIFDPEDSLLKKIPSRGQAPEEQISYALGEGLVRMAAGRRDRRSSLVSLLSLSLRRFGACGRSAQPRPHGVRPGLPAYGGPARPDGGQARRNGGQA